MDKEINEQFIKISSRLPFQSKLNLGDDITITVNGIGFILNCVSSQDRDNQDGTKDVIYSMKWSGE